ncbi:preprotein translocase subunit SecA [Candidatus Sumerlaeota bacterium]
MLGTILKKLLGNKSKRDLRRYGPGVSEINAICDEWFGEIPYAMAESYTESSGAGAIDFVMRPVTRKPTAEEIQQLDELLAGKTAEFRRRLYDGETLDELMPEAFATVKLACWRMIGESWRVLEHNQEWDMVPYDVQLVGATVLHEGRIAEMATGEGKTLVALMPVYLNALEGKGVHLITVNDALAKRDAAWMGHVLEYLGLTVGCLDNTQPQTPERRMQYMCDVTYGTNNEFGFDYLRDNMAVTEEQLTQYVPSLLVGDYLQGLGEFVRENGGETRGLLGDEAVLRLPQEAVDKMLEDFGPQFAIDGITLNAGSATLQWLARHVAGERLELFEERKEVEELPDEQVEIHIRLVMHGHNYAIIDEVDNILIDEARTPLIISGPVDRSTHRFDKMKPLVSSLVKKQTLLTNRLIQEGRDLLAEDPTSYEGAAKLFQGQLSAPKHKALAKVLADGGVQRLVLRAELDYIAWKKNARMADRDMSAIEEELFYVIDEKGHNIDLTDKGRAAISPDDPDMFLLIDLVDEVARIESDESLSEEEKEEAKNKVHHENEIRQEELHNIAQLLRAYSLYEKDVEYVVDDNKIKIVDEFTGRLLDGRRYSDGLHQAIEAKENVAIEIETQTLATVTLQNYFRMYGKLAGMTGTAATEASEFHHTYKMDVIEIPQNKPTGREDCNDLIFRTRKEKYTAVIDEIQELHRMRLPVLVGTVSVDVSETLSRMLRGRKVPHNVLNAKNHLKEAEIVRDAGRAGQVTISTNMAGRGTDIRLQPGELMKGKNDVSEIICVAEDGTEIPYGLQVLGTERHEARRIDLQLRGRGGRQGDPGRSQFFLSLEDDLMRLFGSDRMASMMERFGMTLDEGEPLVHPWLTGAVRNAQKKVEGRNFEVRKRTLDYDDVMNKQRKAIYGLRREVLTSSDAMTLAADLCVNGLETQLTEFGAGQRHLDEFRAEDFLAYLRRRVPYADLKDLEFDVSTSPAELLELLRDKLEEAYKIKRELLGEQLMLRLAKFIMLRSMDENWKDHLLAIDAMREGIWMRSYAQQEPLVAYQKEAGELFLDLEYYINKQILDRLFTTQVELRSEEAQRQEMLYQKQAMEGLPDPADGAATPQGSNEPRKVQPFRRQSEKVGRNQPCPCGSGKKFKKCCGKTAA